MLLRGHGEAPSLVGRRGSLMIERLHQLDELGYGGLDWADCLPFNTSVHFHLARLAGQLSQGWLFAFKANLGYHGTRVFFFTFSKPAFGCSFII